MAVYVNSVSRSQGAGRGARAGAGGAPRMQNSRQKFMPPKEVNPEQLAKQRKKEMDERLLIEADLNKHEYGRLQKVKILLQTQWAGVCAFIQRTDASEHDRLMCESASFNGSLAGVVRQALPDLAAIERERDWQTFLGASREEPALITEAADLLATVQLLLRFIQTDSTTESLRQNLSDVPAARAYIEDMENVFDIYVALASDIVAVCGRLEKVVRYAQHAERRSLQGASAHEHPGLSRVLATTPLAAAAAPPPAHPFADAVAAANDLDEIALAPDAPGAPIASAARLQLGAAEALDVPEELHGFTDRRDFAPSTTLPEIVSATLDSRLVRPVALPRPRTPLQQPGKRATAQPARDKPDAKAAAAATTAAGEASENADGQQGQQTTASLANPLRYKSPIELLAAEAQARGAKKAKALKLEDLPARHEVDKETAGFIAAMVYRLSNFDDIASGRKPVAGAVSVAPPVSSRVSGVGLARARVAQAAQAAQGVQGEARDQSGPGRSPPRGAGAAEAAVCVPKLPVLPAPASPAAIAEYVSPEELARLGYVAEIQAQRVLLRACLFEIHDVCSRYLLDHQDEFLPQNGEPIKISAPAAPGVGAGDERDSTQSGSGSGGDSYDDSGSGGSLSGSLTDGEPEHGRRRRRRANQSLNLANLAALNALHTSTAALHRERLADGAADPSGSGNGGAPGAEELGGPGGLGASGVYDLALSLDLGAQVRSLMNDEIIAENRQNANGPRRPLVLRDIVRKDSAVEIAGRRLGSRPATGTRAAPPRGWAPDAARRQLSLDDICERFVVGRKNMSAQGLSTAGRAMLPPALRDAGASTSPAHSLHVWINTSKNPRFRNVRFSPSLRVVLPNSLCLANVTVRVCESRCDLVGYKAEGLDAFSLPAFLARARYPAGDAYILRPAVFALRPALARVHRTSIRCPEHADLAGLLIDRYVAQAVVPAQTQVAYLEPTGREWETDQGRLLEELGLSPARAQALHGTVLAPDALERALGHENVRALLAAKTGLYANHAAAQGRLADAVRALCLTNIRYLARVAALQTVVRELAFIQALAVEDIRLNAKTRAEVVFQLEADQRFAEASARRRPKAKGRARAPERPVLLEQLASPDTLLLGRLVPCRTFAGVPGYEAYVDGAGAGALGATGTLGAADGSRGGSRAASPGSTSHSEQSVSGLGGLGVTTNVALPPAGGDDVHGSFAEYVGSTGLPAPGQDPDRAVYEAVWRELGLGPESESAPAAGPEDARTLAPEDAAAAADVADTLAEAPQAPPLLPVGGVLYINILRIPPALAEVNSWTVLPLQHAGVEDARTLRAGDGLGEDFVTRLEDAEDARAPGVTALRERYRPLELARRAARAPDPAAADALGPGLRFEDSLGDDYDADDARAAPTGKRRKDRKPAAARELIFALTRVEHLPYPITSQVIPLYPGVTVLRASEVARERGRLHALDSVALWSWLPNIFNYTHSTLTRELAGPDGGARLALAGSGGEDEGEASAGVGAGGQAQAQGPAPAPGDAPAGPAGPVGAGDDPDVDARPDAVEPIVVEFVLPAELHVARILTLEDACVRLQRAMVTHDVSGLLGCYLVCIWNIAVNAWDTDGVEAVAYRPDRRVVSAKVSKTGPLAVVALKYAAMPFRAWSIHPCMDRGDGVSIPECAGSLLPYLDPEGAGRAGDADPLSPPGAPPGAPAGAAGALGSGPGLGPDLGLGMGDVDGPADEHGALLASYAGGGTGKASRMGRLSYYHIGTKDGTVEIPYMTQRAVRLYAGRGVVVHSVLVRLTLPSGTVLTIRTLPEGYEVVGFSDVPDFEAFRDSLQPGSYLPAAPLLRTLGLPGAGAGTGAEQGVGADADPSVRSGGARDAEPPQSPATLASASAVVAASASAAGPGMAALGTAPAFKNTVYPTTTELFAALARAGVFLSFTQDKDIEATRIRPKQRGLDAEMARQLATLATISAAGATGTAGAGGTAAPLVTMLCCSPWNRSLPVTPIRAPENNVFQETEALFVETVARARGWLSDAEMAAFVRAEAKARRAEEKRLAQEAKKPGSTVPPPKRKEVKIEKGMPPPLGPGEYGVTQPLVEMRRAGVEGVRTWMDRFLSSVGLMNAVWYDRACCFVVACSRDTVDFSSGGTRAAEPAGVAGSVAGGAADSAAVEAGPDGLPDPDAALRQGLTPKEYADSLAAATKMPPQKKPPTHYESLYKPPEKKGKKGKKGKKDTLARGSLEGAAQGVDADEHAAGSVGLAGPRVTQTLPYDVEQDPVYAAARAAGQSVQTVCVTAGSLDEGNYSVRACAVPFAPDFEARRGEEFCPAAIPGTVSHASALQLLLSKARGAAGVPSAELDMFIESAMRGSTMDPVLALQLFKLAEALRLASLG